MRRLWIRIYWPLLRAWDRLRLRRLARVHPGLEIHPEASSNLALAEYDLAEGSRLSLGAGVFTERRRGGVRFTVRSGSELLVGDNSWLHTDLGPVHLRAFDGGRLAIGPGAWLNACHISAKHSVELASHAWVGPGSRVLDSDQHALDADHPERSAPVRIGDYVWISADVTVLKGVEIGAHCVIGARSLVNSSIPPHSLAFGMPARVRGTVGDRSKVLT